MLFDITQSQHLARKHLERGSKRRRRSDAGRSRLPGVALTELQAAALDFGRPSMKALHRRISDLCAAAGVKPPARASLYNNFSRLEGNTYAIAGLPTHVVDALYNLPPGGSVPGLQLAFYCFNYGTVPAISFAAGLPWLDLYQALRTRGWRPRSRGLLTAVMRARGIR